MNFKEIKEELKKSVSSVKYFNENTFKIIMKDRNLQLIKFLKQVEMYKSFTGILKLQKQNFI